MRGPGRLLVSSPPSSSLPKEILRFIELCRSAAAENQQDRRWALELCETLTVLSSIGENSGLVAFYKELMILEGHSASRHQIYRDDQLSPSQRQFLHSKEQLLRNCWANWNGK